MKVKPNDSSWSLMKYATDYDIDSDLIDCNGKSCIANFPIGTKWTWGVFGVEVVNNGLKIGLVTITSETNYIVKEDEHFIYNNNFDSFKDAADFAYLINAVYERKDTDEAVSELEAFLTPDNKMLIEDQVPHYFFINEPYQTGIFGNFKIIPVYNANEWCVKANGQIVGFVTRSGDTWHDGNYNWVLHNDNKSYSFDGARALCAWINSNVNSNVIEIPNEEKEPEMNINKYYNKYMNNNNTNYIKFEEPQNTYQWTCPTNTTNANGFNEKDTTMNITARQGFWNLIANPAVRFVAHNLWAMVRPGTNFTRNHKRSILLVLLAFSVGTYFGHVLPQPHEVAKGTYNVAKNAGETVVNASTSAFHAGVATFENFADNFKSNIRVNGADVTIDSLDVKTLMLLWNFIAENNIDVESTEGVEAVQEFFINLNSEPEAVESF